MHELSVIRSLIDTVNEHTQPLTGRKLKSIGIQVGRLTCVDPDRLTFCFTLVRDESGLNNVQLRIHRVKAIVKCSLCSHEYQVEQFGEACQCGSYKHQVLTGNELDLIEIEYR